MRTCAACMTGSLQRSTACKAGNSKLPGRLLADAALPATKEEEHTALLSSHEPTCTCAGGRLAAFADPSNCNGVKINSRTAALGNKDAQAASARLYRPHSDACRAAPRRHSPAKQAVRKAGSEESQAEWCRVAEDFQQLLTCGVHAGGHALTHRPSFRVLGKVNAFSGFCKHDNSGLTNHCKTLNFRS